MGNKKKENKDKKEMKAKQDNVVVVVEYGISMHCNACERTVTKAIFKIKGVEKFVTDMPRNKVIVTGKIDPLKVLKKLRKKTGKRVEIVNKKEDNLRDADDRQQLFLGGPMNPIAMSSTLTLCGDSDLYTMFSDESANACCIM